MFVAVLLNDDATPMEFVVYVLEKLLGLSREQATRRMLIIHETGEANLKTGTAEEAEALAAEINAVATRHNHPLKCVVRPANGEVESAGAG